MIMQNFKKTVFNACEKTRKDQELLKLFSLCDYKKVDEFLNREEIFKQIVSEYSLISGRYNELVRGNNFLPAEVIKSKLLNYIEEDEADKYVATEYLWCPSCKKFHKMHEYTSPKTSWDELIKKYSPELFGMYIWDALHGYGIKDSLNIEMMMLARCFSDYYIASHPYHDSLTLPFSEFDENDNGVIWKCPECGCVFDSVLNERYIFSLNIDTGWKYKVLYRDERWKESNRFVINCEIFDDKKDIVTYSQIDWLIYPNIKGRLHIEHINTRISFNTRTGQTYRFRDVNMYTRKVVDEMAPRIANITYSDMYYFHIPDEMVQELADKICDKKEIPHIDIKEIKNVNNMSILKNLNRYGHFGKDFVRNMCQIYNINKDTRSKLFKMSINSEVFVEQLKRSKVTGKKRKKMYAKNPLLFMMEPTIRKIGFKDNNILLSLIADTEFITSFSTSVCESLGLRNKYNQRIGILKDFVESYTSFKSEAELAKKILACKTNDVAHIFYDTADMFKSLGERVVIDDNAKKKLFTGTLIAMHDKMMLLLNKTKEIPYYIPYTKKEMGLNCECGGYTFELAKTNTEMIDVGCEMHICVGSYDHRAANKKCTIVFMKKDGQLQACIELVDDNKYLNQAKDYCNRILSPEKREAFKTFLVRNKIKTTNCNDYVLAELDECNGNEQYKKIKLTGYQIFEKKEDCKKIPVNELSSFEMLGMELKEDFVRNQNNRNQFNGDWMNIPDNGNEPLPFQ